MFLCHHHLLLGFWYLSCVSSGKPRGLGAARKLRAHRRTQRWADKQYKKAHLGTALKANPFGGASMAKGIVLEKMYVSSPRNIIKIQRI